MSASQGVDRKPLAGWAALIVVYVMWGSTYLAIRVGDRGLPPLALAGIRYLIAGAVLYPVAVRTGGASVRANDRPRLREWLGCALIGLRLLVFGNGGVTVAERTVPSGLAAMLVATVPLWMILFAVPIEHRRVGAVTGGGLLLGLAGVAVLAGGGSAAGHVTGTVIVLAAAASWGFGSVLARRLSLPRRALVAAAMEMCAAGVVLLVAALASGEFNRVSWASVPAPTWLALAWLVVAGSILAFTAYGYALARLPLATVSTYAYVNPVVAVLLGVSLLHEGFSLREAAGAALVIVSVVITLRFQRHGEVSSTTRVGQPTDSTAREATARETAQAGIEA